MALAVVFGLVGVAMVVGKIGGRRLPLVAADLLKYRLGARRYAGQLSQLVRSEAPAPPQPVKSQPDGKAGGPGPLRLMARRSKRAFHRPRKKNRKGKEKDRRSSRRPFRPHGWFGKRRRNVGRDQQGHRAETLESSRESPARGGYRSWPSSQSWRRRSWPSPSLPSQTATSPGGTRSTSRSPSRWRDGGYSSRASPSPATAPSSHSVPQRTWTSASVPSEARTGRGCDSGHRTGSTRGRSPATDSPCTALSPHSPSRGRTTWGRPVR